jgi:hypothetical protein
MVNDAQHHLGMDVYLVDNGEAARSYTAYVTPETQKLIDEYNEYCEKYDVTYEVPDEKDTDKTVTKSVHFSLEDAVNLTDESARKDFEERFGVMTSEAKASSRYTGADKDKQKQAEESTNLLSN